VVGDVVVVFGAVVVVGALVAAVAPVVALVDGEVMAVDPEADEPVVAGVTDDEWAVVLEATTSPRATAAAEAVTPMATVTRRTRAIARSRERVAEDRSVWMFLCRGAMADLSL
jgi:hypothetical protein